MTTTSVRTQILADQAQRAEGEHHTAATVAAVAARVPTTFTVLSAGEQRAIFGPGVAPFGRRNVRHNAARQRFQVRRIVDFGRDWNDQDWSYAEIAGLLNRGQTVVGKKD